MGDSPPILSAYNESEFYGLTGNHGTLNGTSHLYQESHMDRLCEESPQVYL